MNSSLKIHSFPGINIDCLGHYLMSLGLLRATASHWNSTRGFWKDRVFYLAGTFTGTELRDFLLSQWRPQPYVKYWAKAQEIDSDAGNSKALFAARAAMSVSELRVADCTIVPANRNQFSPLFGSGGNIGRRDLATAWNKATDLSRADNSREWLESTLTGNSSVQTPNFKNGGTWFVYNSEAFNSGLRWSRGGFLSPWSYLLAMEGALMVRGASGRRLGAHARPYAVFPFISQPLQPAADIEVGQKTPGEFWAPLWTQPATLTEVRALFQRGLARLGGRAATAPHEFAVAALAAKTDAGLSDFIRFELRQTTSSQVFEAIPRGKFHITEDGNEGDSRHCSTAIMQILGARWFDRLPYEPTSRNSKKRFTGLRGPIERLILAVSETPDDPLPWQALLLRLAESQSGIDRSLNLRKTCRALPRLGMDWVRHAFRECGSVEIRIAAALASLGAKSDYTIACNIYGVEIFGKTMDFARPGRPQRAVWHTGDPLASLLEVVARRLTDADEGRLTVFYSALRLTSAEIDSFLCGNTCDLAEIQKWLPALALIDWSEKEQWAGEFKSSASLAPLTLLWAFFKPFFHPRAIPLGNRAFFLDEAGPKPAFARQLFALLRHGAVREALDLGRAGWAAQGHSVIVPPIPGNIDAPRLAAALALPISSHRLGGLVSRWLAPSKIN